MTITRKCALSQKLVSINLLEFLTEIINYAAVTVLHHSDSSICLHRFPFLLNWTDNQVSKAWIKKAATKTSKGKALQRILCIIMLNNPVGIKADHIAGLLNILADRISRLYSKSKTPPSFTSLMQDCRQMKSWNRFLPSQELLSSLYSALLEGREPDLQQIKTLGHFVPGKIIS